METQTKQWYAVYTRSRCEKKADGILLQKGIETFCPLHKVERRWSDRRKIIEVPVFKSYVFVRITEDERVNVLHTEGVLNFVQNLGKPAIIKDYEIDLIKQFLSEGPSSVSVEPDTMLSANDRVMIKQGVFMDNIGTVMKTRSKKIYVRLESLGRMMVVEFPAGHVSLISKKQPAAAELKNV